MKTTTATNVTIIKYLRSAFYTFQRRDWSGKVITETIPGEDLDTEFYALLQDGTIRRATPWEIANERKQRA